MSSDEGFALTITCYTDPYCTWCWGSEPMLTKLRARYGDKIRFVYKMGGLVRDIRQFYDAANGIGGNDWYKQVAAHWEDASERHGMPVDSRVWNDVKDGFRSTYPACISFKAAELSAPRLASLFLRRLREAAATQRMAIHDFKVTAALAAEIGIDPEDFGSRIESQEAERAFMSDLAECRQSMIQSFPTFMFSNPQGRQYTLASYRRYATFERVARELAAESLGPGVTLSLADHLLDVIELNMGATVREIAEVFDIDETEAQGALDELANEGELEILNAGNGALYRQGGSSSCRIGGALLC